jgi:hypothetical protein
MLEGHFAAGESSEQTILVYESGGVLRGVVCFTERPFADRVWELQMIADYFADGDGKVSFVRRLS